mgnify:FL=1
MGELIPDDVPITALRGIPGTHNSAAVRSRSPCLHGISWEWAQCQTASIAQQLEMGVRFFDLRLRALDAKTPGSSGGGAHVVISHTLASSYSWRDVVLQFVEFLDAHQREVLVVMVKRDWNHRDEWCGEESSDAVWAALHSVAGDARLLPPSALTANGGDLTVRMGDLRGRILPIVADAALLHTSDAVRPTIRRWGVDLSSAECWSCGSQRIAREILLTSVAAKAAAAAEQAAAGAGAAPSSTTLRRHETNVLLLKGVVFPRTVACFMNAWLTGALADGGPLEGSDVGVLTVDFIDAVVARRIVALNCALS